MGKLTAQSPGLHKTLGLPQIVALYVGAVIGSGVLLIPGLAAEKAGPASILAWLLMSILVIPMPLLWDSYPHAIPAREVYRHLFELLTAIDSATWLAGFSYYPCQWVLRS
jgi:L-asparagine transporter-like permease